MKAGDLSSLRSRLKVLTPDVQAALEAEKAMSAAAKRNGVDLDRPQKARAGIKLDKRDVECLRTAMGLARNTRSDMVNIGHQIQDNLDRTRTQIRELKKRLPQKLDDSFYKDLDQKVGNFYAGVQVVKAIQDSARI